MILVASEKRWHRYDQKRRAGEAEPAGKGGYKCLTIHRIGGNKKASTSNGGIIINAFGAGGTEEPGKRK